MQLAGVGHCVFLSLLTSVCCGRMWESERGFQDSLIYLALYPFLLAGNFIQCFHCHIVIGAAVWMFTISCTHQGRICGKGWPSQDYHLGIATQFSSLNIFGVFSDHFNSNVQMIPNLLRVWFCWITRFLTQGVSKSLHKIPECGGPSLNKEKVSSLNQPDFFNHCGVHNSVNQIDQMVVGPALFCLECNVEGIRHLSAATLQIA